MKKNLRRYYLRKNKKARRVGFHPRILGSQVSDFNLVFSKPSLEGRV
jgi:hypothetical protein